MTAVPHDAPSAAREGVLPRVVLFAALWVVLLWPIAWNGDPLGFPDSEAYYEQGGQVVDRILGAVLPPDAEVAGAADPAEAEANQVYTIRSVPFSTMVNVAMRIAGEVGAVALLSAVTAWLILLAVRDLPPGRAALAGLVAAGATSLPFYTAQVMADVMAGWLVLIAGLLALRSWGRWTVAALLVLAFLSIASHYSHVALGLVLMPALGLVLAIQRRFALAAAVQAPLLIALALNVTVGIAAGSGVSVAPSRLPILLARTLADGPGREYLAETCPESGWTLCDIYPDELPTRVGEALWGSESIIARATTEQRRAIAAEEVPLVLAVLRAHPVDQSAALVRNAVRQLGAIGLDDVRRTEMEILSSREMDLSLDRLERDAPIRVVEPVQWAAVGAGLLGAAMALAAGGPGARVALGVVAFGLVVNAAICGGLSAPADRYQGRVIWVLVLMGLALMPAPVRDPSDGRVLDRRGRLVRRGARGLAR